MSKFSVCCLYGVTSLAVFAGCTLWSAQGSPSTAAFTDHGTYQSRYGAELLAISPKPGGATKVAWFTITARVGFPAATGSLKTFVMHRDGQPVADSRQTKPAGQTTYDYEWTDRYAPVGEHTYVLHVGEVLITSPMHVTCTRPPVQRLAFVSSRTGNSEIYVIDADGAGEKRLTHSSASKAHPSWSPDGSQIVFVRGDPWSTEGSRIWMINADGSDPQLLAESQLLAEDGGGNPAGLCVQPAWSPDGWTIAFVAETHRSPSLRLLDVRSHKERVLFAAKRDTFISDLQWSPAGESIAFSIQTDESRICIASVSEGCTRTLTAGQDAVWSPDGGRLAFVSWLPDNTGGVFTIGKDGRDLREVCRNTHSVFGWSSDGTRLLVASGEDKDLYWLNVKTGAEKHLAQWVGDIAWSPEGQSIAFNVYRPGDDPYDTPFPVYVMNADGSGRKQICQDGSDMAWCPVPQ